MSSLAAFREVICNCSKLFVITGAGISADSGIPTFRGEGGYWQKYSAKDLATPLAFSKNPSLVWEFYHYRRELLLTKSPNAAHIALADLEKQFHTAGREFTLVTQNVDGLHARAGSRNIIELHGNLFKVRCTVCGKVFTNFDSPICSGLAGRGLPDSIGLCPGPPIAVRDLPRCQADGCGGLLRPHVVWFGESLNIADMSASESALEGANACLVVGTSSTVYPAADFAFTAISRGIPVAEFSLDPTPLSGLVNYHFMGRAAETLSHLMLNFKLS